MFLNKQQTMTKTINVSPLPTLDSHRILELQLSNSLDHYTAYNMILQAEWYAFQRQAMEDTMAARVVGYLLLEFHAQYDTFGDRPCASLVQWVTSPPQNSGDNESDVIFSVGKHLCNTFIRLCASSKVSS